MTSAHLLIDGDAFHGCHIVVIVGGISHHLHLSPEHPLSGGPAPVPELVFGAEVAAAAL